MLSTKVNKINAERRILSALPMWVVVLGALLAATYWSTRFALADLLFQANDLSSLRRAVALAPGNARYRAILAEHMEGAGLDPSSQLEKATRLSPLQSPYWIRRGFQSESQHDYGHAEEYLLRAAAVDHEFDPRWALMSYYFRRGKSAEFWRWTDRAFEFSYSDPTPLFRLAWNMTQDPAVIRAHVPTKFAILSRYLQYLADTQRLDLSAPVAHDLASIADPASDIRPLLTWLDNAIASYPAAVLNVWNILCGRGALPFKMLDPGTGIIVTNGDFSLPPLYSAFDWRMARSEGVSVLPDAYARQLSVTFSGNEPESLLLAEQYIPLTPGLQYAISWEDKSPPGDSVSGLIWTVSTPSAASIEWARSMDLAAGPEWKTGRMVFSAGTNELARLRLSYYRPLGSVRARGAVMLRNVRGQIVR